MRVLGSGCFKSADRSGLLMLAHVRGVVLKSSGMFLFFAMFFAVVRLP